MRGSVARRVLAMSWIWCGSVLAGTITCGGSGQPECPFTVNELDGQIDGQFYTPTLLQYGSGYTGSGTYSVNGGSFSVNGLAESSYGVLKASVFSSITATASPTSAYFLADVGFVDSMEIDYAPLTGQTGFLDLSYTLDGNISKSGSSNAWLETWAEVVASGRAQPQSAIFASSISGVFAFPGSFTFTYGQPFDLWFFLFPYVGTVIPPVVPSDVYTTTSAGSGSADFSNTMVLSGLQVFDSQMNPVPGASFTSGSGTAYGPDGVAPEPSSVLLLAPALLMLGVLHHRRKQRYLQVKACRA